MPSALVLEYESNQWVLYFVNAEDKIESCYFPGSLEAAFAYTRDQFGIRPEEWTEDSPN
jgi:hypothetical protein